jgi:hypothetical protein
MTGIGSSAEAKDISSSLCFHTSSDAYPASYPVGTRGVYMRLSDINNRSDEDL